MAPYSSEQIGTMVCGGGLAILGAAGAAKAFFAKTLKYARYAGIVKSKSLDGEVSYYCESRLQRLTVISIGFAIAIGALWLFWKGPWTSKNMVLGFGGFIFAVWGLTVAFKAKSTQTRRTNESESYTPTLTERLIAAFTPLLAAAAGVWLFLTTFFYAH